MVNDYSENFRNYPRRPKDKSTPSTYEPVSRSNDNDEDWDECVYPIYSRGWDLNSDDAPDDENDWGGLEGVVTTKSPVIVAEPATKKDNATTSHKNPNYRPLVLADDEKFRWLIPGVIAGGPHPVYFTFEKDLKAYRAAGFKSILSVYDEALDMSLIDGLDYYFMPTKDDEVPNLEASCRHIDDMIRQHKPVYVHCFDGRGVTGTVLAAYLIYKGWLTANEAIAYVRQKYSDFAVETFEQAAALHEMVDM